MTESALKGKLSLMRFHMIMHRILVLFYDPTFRTDEVTIRILLIRIRHTYGV